MNSSLEVEIITSADVIPYLEAHFGPVRHYLRNPDIEEGWERDSQRKRVYDAEHAFEEVNGAGKILLSIDECQDCINKTLKCEYWRTHYPYIKSVKAVLSKGKHAMSTFFWGLIELPPHFFNELTILHELAHHVVPRPHAHHGPLWCAVYVDLVREFLDKELAANLVKAFQDGRVRFGPLV